MIQVHILLLPCCLICRLHNIYIYIRIIYNMIYDNIITSNIECILAQCFGACLANQSASALWCFDVLGLKAAECWQRSLRPHYDEQFCTWQVDWNLLAPRGSVSSILHSLTCLYLYRQRTFLLLNADSNTGDALRNDLCESPSSVQLHDQSKWQTMRQLRTSPQLFL